jgi:hypothetical protein
MARCLPLVISSQPQAFSIFRRLPEADFYQSGLSPWSLFSAMLSPKSAHPFMTIPKWHSVLTLTPAVSAYLAIPERVLTIRVPVCPLSHLTGNA